ncbi:hypothetical protein PDQ34_25990 [Bacillus cereus]|nr:hypothetical protein [Bacillus cereus]MDA2572671.1 hypothetical protein [Bacillus cereus]
MSYAIITFSNNEKLIVHEGDIFVLTNLVDCEGEQIASPCKSYEIQKHHHDGFTNSLIEMFSSSLFFRKLYNQNTTYSSSAVVKITNF